MKVCYKCKTGRMESEFWRNKSRKDGLDPKCKSCTLVYSRTPARKLQSSIRAKARWQENKSHRRYRQTEIRKRNYKLLGTTIGEYEKLLAAQNGVCAICGEIDSIGKRLAVDHCHSTKRIRGLLCFRCNRGIGLFSEDCEKLLKASQYLSR